MLFKNRIRNKANKMFDDLIVDPSFIKHNSPKNKTPFINVLAPALSAAVCVLLIGGVTTSLILIGKNNKNHIEQTWSYIKNQIKNIYNIIHQINFIY